MPLDCPKPSHNYGWRKTAQLSNGNCFIIVALTLRLPTSLPSITLRTLMRLRMPAPPPLLIWTYQLDTHRIWELPHTTEIDSKYVFQSSRTLVSDETLLVTTNLNWQTLRTRKNWLQYVEISQKSIAPDHASLHDHVHCFHHWGFKSFRPSCNRPMSVLTNPVITLHQRNHWLPQKVSQIPDPLILS